MSAAVGRLDEFPRYSYRKALSLEAFPDDKPLIVFDGVCVLCTGFASFVIRHDRGKRFRFTTAQSSLGQALYRHYGLNPTEFETNLLIADGQAFAKLEAFAAIMDRLGRGWRLLRLVLWLPRPLRNWLYDRIALNRYRLFGRTDACMRPPPNWHDRYLA